MSAVTKIIDIMAKTNDLDLTKDLLDLYDAMKDQENRMVTHEKVLMDNTVLCSLAKNGLKPGCKMHAIKDLCVVTGKDFHESRDIVEDVIKEYLINYSWNFSEK
jgi:hypothetical protein